MKSTAIIGGGPAGAMAAEILARGGMSVTVFEERLGWEKPCGGGLTHKALERYPFLLDGTGEPKRVREVEFVAPNASVARFRAREPLVVYSRARLNQVLLSRAAVEGTEIIPERITNVQRASRGWALRGRARSYRADYLVLAAGARSRLRSLLTEDFAARDFMLTFGYYVPGSDDVLRVQFLEDFEGYAWAFPRLDHISVGICGKVGEDRMSGLRDRLSSFMRKFGYGTDCASVYSHLLPSLTVETWSNLQIAGDGWALVGDAAGLVDPLTGEGIYYAMRSGELVAESLLEGVPEMYAERVRREFSSLALGARLAPFFYCGDFLGGPVTARLVEFATRSPCFMQLVQDLIEGSQSYSGLAARLYRTFGRSLAEIAAGAFRAAIANSGSSYQ